MIHHGEIRVGNYPFRVISSLLSSELVPAFVRTKALRAIGFQISKTTCIWARCSLRSNKIRTTGQVFINIAFYHDGYETLEIGRNVRIGPHVSVITASHEIGPASQRAPMEVTGAPVRIGDGCWIGAGVTILPGVTIADGCVVGAQSLVAKSTEPNGLYVGTPARRVRDLDTLRAGLDEEGIAAPESPHAMWRSVRLRPVREDVYARTNMGPEPALSVATHRMAR
jgi:maltose O-acetyltransferase